MRGREEMPEINTVKVRKTEIGAGMPKICIPVTGITGEEILEGAARAKDLGADLVEWRADWYEEISEPGSMEAAAAKLRGVLGDVPLLFTFRTKREGGERELAPESYIGLIERAIRSGNVDLVDVELFTGEGEVRRMTEEAHRFGVMVIASNHDFRKTPPKEEIVSRMCRMQELGADILKVAVMPENARDVLVLLDATETVYSRYARCPIITMAMGGLGTVSRISGEVFGSAVTFGASGRASAPGQIQADDLRKVMDCLHDTL